MSAGEVYEWWCRCMSAGEVYECWCRCTSGDIIICKVKKWHNINREWLM